MRPNTSQTVGSAVVIIAVSLTLWWRFFYSSPAASSKSSEDSKEKEGEALGAIANKRAVLPPENKDKASDITKPSSSVNDVEDETTTTSSNISTKKTAEKSQLAEEKRDDIAVQDTKIDVSEIPAFTIELDDSDNDMF